MTFPRYDKYKDSGVEWLGEIPAHWAVAPPKYFLRSLSGAQTTKSSVSDEQSSALFPAFSASGQDVWISEPQFDIPGIVLSAVGARCGKTFKADGKWGVVANTHCLMPGTRLDRDFFWYVSNNESWWEKGGTAQPFVKVADTLARKWVFPALDEQRTIAAFLDRETAKIDDLVAEQQNLIALLKEKRQALISHAVTKGLNPNVPMKDSGVEWLGEVPAHWEVMPLKHLTTSMKAGPFGSALTKDMYVSSGYRVYGQEQVIPGDFAIGDYYITPEDFSALEQYAVASDDVLISCVGTFGKIAIVPPTAEPGIINPRLIRLRVGCLVSPRYLVELMRSEIVFEQFTALSRGGTMDVINIGTLSNIVVHVPPREEQPAIKDFVTSESSKIDDLMTESESTITLLQERRTALISAAVTGKIDVRNRQPDPHHTTAAATEAAGNTQGM